MALQFFFLTYDAAAKQTVSNSVPLVVYVYQNRNLDRAAIIHITGIDQDSSLSTDEVKQRLQNTGLFSRVRVTRTLHVMKIVVLEKTAWFVLPYFSNDSATTIFGVGAGKMGNAGHFGDILARYQFGKGSHEAGFLVRDEYFRETFLGVGFSFDYVDTSKKIFLDRELKQSTINQYWGGSLQLKYHLNPYFIFALNTYIEEHQFEEPSKLRVQGLQLSHRFNFELSNFYNNEGLAKGASVRAYFETTNPVSTFQFRKYGASSQISVFQEGQFNWITLPRFEMGTALPYYQLHELGGESIRGFPSQQFRDQCYFSEQNDFLLTSFDLWKLIFRPLVFYDWAFIEKSARMGMGAGLQLNFRSVAIPVLKIYAGYGFNPNGVTISTVLGAHF